ncbi:MAG: STN domain-containing protein [Microscillaceae bacterium]|jgi:hypothetical protein|nr:STN domain-containing protein [Microscillaceae bacterium]
MPKFYIDRFLLLLIVNILWTNIALFAQKAVPPLERTVSLRLQNSSTEQALEQLAEQGDVQFSYSPSAIDAQKKVNIIVKQQTLREALNQIFQGSVKYKSRANYVILTKQTSSENARKITISGYLSDSLTYQKLKQVSIYDKNTLLSAISDQYGFYQIKLNTDKPTITLTFSRDGYQTRDFTFNLKETNFLNISLLPLRKRTNLAINPLPRQEIYTTVFEDSLRHLDSSSVVAFFVPSKQRVHALNIREFLPKNFQISFLPFAGTNHLLGGNVVNDYSLNILAGYGAGVRKFELGGIANLNRGRVEGWQIGGVLNLTGEAVHGVQIGGMINANRDSVYGVQIGGIVNVNGKDTDGVQIAGMANFSGKAMRGVQVGGIANIVVDSLYGVQIAGIANFNLHKTAGVQIGGILNLNVKDTYGVQVGGIANLNRGGLEGIQVAGITNLLGGKLNGTQVSSIFNYAQKVRRGFQIGLVNYADSARTLTQIGLINFVRRGGYKRLELSANEIAYLNLTIRSGTPGFYTLYNLGLRPMPERPLWYWGYGLGVFANWGRGWGLNTELIYQQVSRTLGRGNGFRNHLGKFQLLINKKLGKHWELAFGPSTNFFYLRPEHPDFNVLKDLALYTFWEDANAKRLLQASIGFNVGFRYIFL